jgi:ADP-ribose pyrophosphatase
MSEQQRGRYVGPYTILHSRPIYENPWIKVREDRVSLRGGVESVFGVVAMKPGVTVLPLEGNGEVCLVREFKYALGDYSLEAISGGLEPGETPEQGGMRELAEECGLTASEWVDLGVINPFTTIIHSANHMFLARGLSLDRRIREPSEELEVVKMSFEDALYAVLRGQITHGASCALILKTKFFLERRR